MNIQDYLIGVLSGISVTCWASHKYAAALFFAVAELLLFADRMGNL